MPYPSAPLRTMMMEVTGPMLLYISGQEEAIEYATRVNPTALLSIQDPGPAPIIPTGSNLKCHLRLEFHDVCDDRVIYPSDYMPPALEHIEGIVELGKSWDQRGSLFINCQAGVSRSTAAALIILSALRPGDEYEYARQMRIKGPWISPNRLMIRLADRLLGCNGRLIYAVDALAEPSMQGGFHLLEVPLKSSEL
jgi:predicted protein tyrosine phosphatase